MGDRVAVRPIVIRVDLVGIAIRPIAIKLQVDHSWRVIRQPHSAKFRAGRRQTFNRCISRPVATNVNTQWIMPVPVGLIIPRQNDAGAQVDGAAVEPGEEIRLDLDVLQVLIAGRQLLRWDFPGQFQLHRPTLPAIEVNAVNVAVEIARRVEGFQIDV